MLYFKRIEIYNFTLAEIEPAVRKLSIKSAMPLDLNFSATDIGTNKFFLGYDGKRNTTFTRIKTSLESLLPKFIIKFSSDSDQTFYALRFSVISTVIFCLISMQLLSTLYAAIFDHMNFEAFIALMIFSGIYFLLVFAEFKLTTSRIKKAIRISFTQ